MPKTKEQKQREALERESINIWRDRLLSLIKELPGGGIFSTRGFNKQDLKSCIDEFDKLCFAAVKFNLKFPGIDIKNEFDLAQVHSARRLLSVISSVWIGQLTDIYEQQYKKHNLHPSYEISNHLNAAGKARDIGVFSELRIEVGFFTERLREYCDELSRKEKEERKEISAAKRRHQVEREEAFRRRQADLTKA